jgi:outer membrane protein assembly factor BamB
MKMIRLIGALTAVAVLGGCDTWFGESDGPPLPGDRISVLLHDRKVSSDPDLAGLEVKLPRPWRNPEWPQAGGGSNHAMHHVEVSASPVEAWDTGVGEGASDEARMLVTPIVADGIVYTMDAESMITAVAASDGDRLWEIELGELFPEDEDDGLFGGGLAIEDGRLFVTTGFAHVLAFDAKTGAEIWRAPTLTPMRAAPAVRGGRVFAMTVENELFAFSAADGSQLWSYTGNPQSASLLGAAAPAVDGGIVVAAFSSGDLFAFRVDTGSIVWNDSLKAVRRTESIANLADIRGLPVIDRGRVYAAGHGGVVAAIELRSGRRFWQAEFVSAQTPWVAGEFIYLLTVDNELLCLTASDGRVKWVTLLPVWEDPEDRKDRIFWNGPVLAGDRLLVTGSAGEALAVSPYTGKILGRKSMPDSVSLPPVVADGSIYFLTDDAELVSYR